MGERFYLGSQSDECLAVMIEKEYHHLPAADYLTRLKNEDLDIGDRLRSSIGLQRSVLLRCCS